MGRLFRDSRNWLDHCRKASRAARKSWAEDGEVGTREYLKDKCEELYKRIAKLEKALKKIITQPLMVHTNMKIAKKILRGE